ncbi:hypothetical protein MCHI_002812 [Candidatus Magnetoovum chiemensis]|nr:hypothetical protein MCHI_002812 [Candidatus Magnetoovum chiemensis]
MSESQFKEKAPCSVKMAMPSEIECPSCGYVNEVWNDDEEPKCKECGTNIKNAA